MAADASSLEEPDTSQVPSGHLGPDERAYSRLAKTAFGSPPRKAAFDRLPKPEARSSARASSFGRLARHLSTIMDVNRRLALGPDLNQILARITEEAAGLLETEASGLRLLEGDELARAATFGAADAMMARERLRLGESLSGRVALENRPIMSTNLGADARYDPLHQAQARRHQFRAWLGVPLRGREGVLGTLFVASKGSRSFDRADVRLLEAFANQAAIAIENARAFDQEQERLRQLEAIRTVTAEITRELDLTAVLKLIWQRAAELVESEAGAIFLWEEAEQELVAHTWSGLGDWMSSIRMKLGEGTPGIAAERREGLIVNDYRESPYAHPLILARTNITSSLAEPIVYQDRLVGVIVVAHESASKRFTEQDRDLLGLFATQAAIAIENARLHEVTRRRAQHLGALNDLSRRLTTVLDPA
jgi:GAF domain-containing protein